jgi:hypothetical protein
MHLRRGPLPPLRAAALRPALVALVLGLALTAAGATARPAEAATVRVAADGDCLNLRQQPSLAGAVLSCVDDGTLVTTIAGQTTTADGLDWQQVHAGEREGGRPAPRPAAEQGPYLARAADCYLPGAPAAIRARTPPFASRSRSGDSPISSADALPVALTHLPQPR